MPPAPRSSGGLRISPILHLLRLPPVDSIQAVDRSPGSAAVTAAVVAGADLVDGNHTTVRWRAALNEGVPMRTLYGRDAAFVLLDDMSAREIGLWLRALLELSGDPVDEAHVDGRTTFTYDDLLVLRTMRRLRKRLGMSHTVAAATTINLLAVGTDRVSVALDAACQMVVVDVGQIRRELERFLTFNRRCQPLDQRPGQGADRPLRAAPQPGK